MPFANNQGVRIHYEVEGDGPPLVLMHGGYANLEQWRILGLVEALKNDYRLVMLDARGHGASDKPHESEAYKLTSLVGDVVAVLDDLNISKAHYLGYSLGGAIGHGIAKYAPDRFHSLIIGGYGPLWERDPAGLNSYLELSRVKEGMQPFIAAWKARFGARWSPEWEAITRANDLDAQIARVSAEEGVLLTGFKDLVPTATVPCLIYAGEEDEEGARECAKHMPNATFVVFPGLGHIEAGCRIDLVVPLVRKFLAEVGEG